MQRFCGRCGAERPEVKPDVGEENTRLIDEIGELGTALIVMGFILNTEETTTQTATRILREQKAEIAELKMDRDAWKAEAGRMGRAYGEAVKVCDVARVEREAARSSLEAERVRSEHYKTQLGAMFDCASELREAIFHAYHSTPRPSASSAPESQAPAMELDTCAKCCRRECDGKCGGATPGEAS